jgi:hypothetical protein
MTGDIVTFWSRVFYFIQDHDEGKMATARICYVCNKIIKETD